LNKGQTLLIPL